MLGGLEGFRVTLLHVISVPEEDYSRGSEEKEKWLEDYRRRIESLLAEYRRDLIGAGFPEAMVQTRAPQRYCPSIAECILKELESTECGPSWSAGRGCPARRSFSSAVFPAKSSARPQLRRVGGA